MKKSSRTLELDDECGMVCIGRRVRKPFLLLEWIERLSEKFTVVLFLPRRCSKSSGYLIPALPVRALITKHRSGLRHSEECKVPPCGLRCDFHNNNFHSRICHRELAWKLSQILDPSQVREATPRSPAFPSLATQAARTVQDWSPSIARAAPVARCLENMSECSRRSNELSLRTSFGHGV